MPSMTPLWRTSVSGDRKQWPMWSCVARNRQSLLRKIAILTRPLLLSGTEISKSVRPVEVKLLSGLYPQNYASDFNMV